MQTPAGRGRAKDRTRCSNNKTGENGFIKKPRKRWKGGRMLDLEGFWGRAGCCFKVLRDLHSNAGDLIRGKKSRIPIKMKQVSLTLARWLLVQSRFQLHEQRKMSKERLPRMRTCCIRIKATGFQLQLLLPAPCLYNQGSSCCCAFAVS